MNLTRVVSQVDSSLRCRRLRDLLHAGSKQVFELLNVVILGLILHIKLHIEAELVHISLPRLSGGTWSTEGVRRYLACRIGGFVVVRVLVTNSVP